MKITVVGGLVNAHCTWPELKEVISNKNLKLQYGETEKSYNLFAIDTPIIYLCSIFKDGFFPSVCDQTEEENTAWRTDFEANNKNISNQPLLKRQPDGSFWVVPTGREGSETIQSTVNYADKCTWWQSSVRITDETLTDSGNGLTFTSAHPFWIDLEHGRCFDEDELQKEAEHLFKVVVKVNGVTQTMREPFETTGGDYIVDYETGTITFSSSQTGNTVTASYNYAGDSCFVLKPLPGRTIDVDYVEIDVSVDVVMNDTIRFEVFGWVQVFAPQLWDGYDPPGPLPTNYLIPIQTTRYKTIRQIKQESIGCSPKMPPLSSGNNRGNNSDWVTLPFRYGAIRRLWASKGMELRISLEHNRAFEGDNATATFYCISRAESELAP